MHDGGVMGKTMRAYDWTTSPIGPPDTWPHSLCVVVNIMLNSQAPMCVLWGPQRFCFYNDASIKIYGANHPSAFHRPMFEIWPETRNTLGAIFADVFSGQSRSLDDLQLTLERNGLPETVFFTINLVPVRARNDEIGGILGTYFETTAAVMAEQKLLAQVQRQRLLFNQAPGFIAILIGPDHVFEFCNEAFYRLVRKHEVLGKAVIEVVPEVESQGFIQLLNEVYWSGKRIVQSKAPIVFNDSDGLLRETLYVDFVYEPIVDEAGLVTGIFCQGSDVTAQKTAEDALLKVQRMEAVGRLTAGVAHDFNNLLQAIFGALEVMQDGPALSDHQLESVATIAKASQHGAALIRNLLTFSRKQALDPALVRPADLISGFTPILRLATGGTIRFQTRLPKSVWPINVNQAELQACLMNLVINARDAMPAGGTIVVQICNVGNEDAVAAGLPEGNYVRFQVHDEGEGMPPETMARAAEPFFTTKALGKGTGLGLSVVHGFARQSGGLLQLESEIGRGSTVSLWLPRSLEGSAASPSKRNAARTETARVLVADDDGMVRNMLALFLKHAGYIPLLAESGDEALALLNAGQECALLVTDQSMPGITGIELITAVAALRPELPVMLITGFSTTEVETQLGSDITVVHKPFDRTTFLAHVHRLIGSNEQGIIAH
jgi:signal transduction histidine kinase